MSCTTFQWKTSWCPGTYLRSRANVMILRLLDSHWCPKKSSYTRWTVYSILTRNSKLWFTLDDFYSLLCSKELNLQHDADKEISTKIPSEKYFALMSRGRGRNGRGSRGRGWWNFNQDQNFAQSQTNVDRNTLNNKSTFWGIQCNFIANFDTRMLDVGIVWISPIMKTQMFLSLWILTLLLTGF